MNIKSIILKSCLFLSIVAANNFGQIGIIVNKDLAGSINTAVATLVNDIQTREGKTVWLENTQFNSSSSPAAVRQALRTRHDQYGLEGAIFIGDLPIAWYEVANDYDTYGYRSFPFDLYYMDLNGDWLDTASWGETGVLDGHSAGTGDLLAEIWVSRIVGSTVNDLGSEVDVINQYLAKVHNRMTGNDSLAEKMVICGNDGEWGGCVSWAGADQLKYASLNVTTYLRSQSSTAFQDTKANWMAALRAGQQSAALFEHSSETNHGVIDGFSSSDYLAMPTTGGASNVRFYNLFACSNCRYTVLGFLGGLYAWGHNGLIAVGSTKTGSMLGFEGYNTDLGNGVCFGQAFLNWLNANVMRYTDNVTVSWYFGMTLLGAGNLHQQKYGGTTDPCSGVQGGGNGLQGTTFGLNPSWATGSEYCKATDGDTNTFYDYSQANGGYTGLDLGSAKEITKVRYYPRANWASRIVGGKFQGSNTSSSSGFVDLYTIQSTPAVQWNEVTISDSTGYQWVRYLAPDSGYGNIAEMEFYSAQSQSPYNGPHNITNDATLQAEDFDNGVEGVAYHDNDTSNNGGAYRTEVGVDIETCGAGGYNVGWINSGEWMEYTCNVTGGTYNITLYAASPYSGTQTVNLYQDNTLKATFTVPNTGGWQTFQAITVNEVSLSTGSASVLKIESTTGGYNLDKIAIAAAGTQYTITASAGSNGSISPSGSVTVNYNASQTFTITTNSDYVVDAVTVDGTSQGSITSYTFSSVNANHTISATFKSSQTDPCSGVQGGGSGLQGTTFGLNPPWSAGSEYCKATDGDINTFYDYSQANGGYTGLDLGSAKVITKVRYYPRADWASRIVGGKFQGSNTSSSSGFVDLYTIQSTPAVQWNEVTISNSTGYQWVRYLSPDGGYGNVAEMEFSESAVFPDPNKWYKIATKANTSLCLDVTGGSYANSTVIELLIKANVNQEFKFKDAGNGYYTISCRADTGYSIDMNGNFASGQTLKLWTTDVNNVNQKFKLVAISGGYYRLETSNSSFSIDNWGAGGNGTQPALWTSDDSNDNQQWVITEVQ